MARRLFRRLFRGFICRVGHEAVAGPDLQGRVPHTKRVRYSGTHTAHNQHMTGKETPNSDLAPAEFREVNQRKHHLHPTLDAHVHMSQHSSCGMNTVRGDEELAPTKSLVYH